MSIVGSEVLKTGLARYPKKDENRNREPRTGPRIRCQSRKRVFPSQRVHHYWQNSFDRDRSSCRENTTDEAIVLLNLPILDRSQHLQNLRPGGKLKKVVVVPRVATQGTPIPLEDFYFAVNSKQFLYEGPSEMKQAHRERTLVLSSERSAIFLQELTKVRAQFYGRGRFPAT